MAYFSGMAASPHDFNSLFKQFFLSNPESAWEFSHSGFTEAGVWEPERYYTTINHKKRDMAGCFAIHGIRGTNKKKWKYPQIGAMAGTVATNSFPGLLNPIGKKYWASDLYSTYYKIVFPCHVYFIATDEAFTIVHAALDYSVYDICMIGVCDVVAGPYAGEDSFYYCASCGQKSGYGYRHFWHPFSCSGNYQVGSNSYIRSVVRDKTFNENDFYPVTMPCTGARNALYSSLAPDFLHFEPSDTRVFLPYLIATKQENGRYAPEFELPGHRITTVKGIEPSDFPMIVEYHEVPWLIFPYVKLGSIRDEAIKKWYDFGVAIKAEPSDAQLLLS